MLADGEVAAFATSIIDGRVLHLLTDDEEYPEPLCSTRGKLSLITAERAKRPWYARRHVCTRCTKIKEAAAEAGDG